MERERWYAVTCSDNCNRAGRGGTWWLDLRRHQKPRGRQLDLDRDVRDRDSQDRTPNVGGTGFVVRRWDGGGPGGRRRCLHMDRCQLGSGHGAISAKSCFGWPSRPTARKVVAVGSNGALSTGKRLRELGPNPGPGPVDNTDWFSVACSNNCSTLVMAEYYGHIYTSSDGGVSWTQHESPRYWQSVSASADGIKLVATGMGRPGVRSAYPQAA